VRRQSFPPEFSTRVFQIRSNFHETLEFCASADILGGRQYFMFADILGGRHYFMILLDFVAANICVYFQYLFMHLSMRQYFWLNCFDLRFKIFTEVMII
jgi:hypothetical protein